MADPNEEIANALVGDYFSDLPIPGTTGPQYQPTFWEKARNIPSMMNHDLEGAARDIASALMAPGNALQGAYNYVEVNPDGSVNPFNQDMIDSAAALSGLVSLGSAPIPRPANSLGMGGVSGRPNNLPFSDSLSLPAAPSVEQLRSLARVEKVPLAQARATNSLQWDRFNAGDHPPPMAEGFTDRPIAVRKENGEYLIYDGHHRTALAASDGMDAVDMYVIDAKDYAPMDAGRKPQASKADISDEDLLRMLGL